MNTGATTRGLWPTVGVVAAALVALDVAALAAIVAVGNLTSLPVGSAFEAWTLFHWPTFAVAKAMLPMPRSLHDAAPLGLVIGLLVPMLLQTAVVGACFGALVAHIRRRRHAL